ncbi:hypothetical protein ACSA002_1460 [Salmonella phage vB_SalM_SA002]|nr:hypothetical protein ACSA002_1460 [Salmonella phage vB_SalM_SA002]
MSENTKCLVQLDALMDTRLGTLKRLSPDGAELIRTTWYHKRTSDQFDRNGSKINQAAYTALYSARDEETLKLSMMTQLPKYLMTLIARLTSTQGMPLLSQQFKIDINYYPYELSEQVLTAIQVAMETYTNGAAEINMVYYAPEDLTVTMVKSCYDIVFLYDFNEWLMQHTKEFEKAQIPEVRMVAPKLYLKDVPSQLLEKVNHEEYVWEQMSMVFMGLVGVVFMDANLYSIVTDTPPDLDP